MSLTTEEKVRNTIKIHNTDVLTHEEIDQAIEDAATQINVSDELAERYLTCFLIAESVSWDKVKSVDGTTFEPPKPEKFDKLYTNRLRQLGKGKMKKVNWQIHDEEDYSD